MSSMIWFYNKKLIYTKRNPSAATVDKAKQTELQANYKQPCCDLLDAVRAPSDLHQDALRLARWKTGPALSCKERWSPLILPIERKTIIPYATVINTALWDRALINSKHRTSDTVAFHPSLSY